MPQHFSPQTHAASLADILRKDRASWRGFAAFLIETEDADAVASLAVDLDCMAFQIDPTHYLVIGNITEFPVGITILARAVDAAAEMDTLLAWLGEEPAQETQTETEEPLPPLSVLLVEDEMMTRRLVENFLNKHVSAVAVENSRSAHANYAVHEPDIVFLDVHYMNDMHDGFDVLRNIMHYNPEAFVVMFSGDAAPCMRYRALANGAQGFIPKPFDPADFVYYLHRAAAMKNIEA